MTGRLMSAACVLFAVAACSQPAEDVIVDEPGFAEPAGDLVNEDTADDSERIHFAPTFDAATAEQWVTVYPMLDHASIVAAVPVPVVSGVQFLKFDLFLPNGAPYRVFWRAYSLDADAPERAVHPTTEAELPVESPKRSGALAYLHIGIPIDGTKIMEYQLDGTYRVEARVGVDTSAPPTAVGDFEITLPDGM